MVNSPLEISTILVPISSVISVSKVDVDSAGIEGCVLEGKSEVGVIVRVAIEVGPGACSNHLPINGELSNPAIVVPTHPIKATTMAVFHLRDGFGFFCSGLSPVDLSLTAFSAASRFAF